MQPPDVLPLFKVEVILEAVPENLHVHVFRGVLGGAGTQAVKAQGVFVIPLGVILAPGVELAEDQLPVIALLLGVVVHRAAPTEVLDLDGAIGVLGEDNFFPVAGAGLVDGVG